MKETPAGKAGIDLGYVRPFNRGPALRGDPHGKEIFPGGKGEGTAEVLEGPGFVQEQDGPRFGTKAEFRRGIPGIDEDLRRIPVIGPAGDNPLCGNGKTGADRFDPYAGADWGIGFYKEIRLGRKPGSTL
jgi:hypothetical protein